MALNDHVRLDRGVVAFDAQEVLASGEFQAMSLEERGRWFTETLNACPIPEVPCRYVPIAERKAVAARYGASEGAAVPVKCPCGATGEILWAPRRIRFVGMDLDHVHPVSRGGANRAENLQLLCPSCNRSKGARVA